MQNIFRRLIGIALAAATLSLAGYGGMIGTATRAEAGTCYDLWYQRNAIFAQRGYCFKGCGRRVWGNNCFPPYGKLTRYQWSQVNQIKAQESAYGCPPCPQTWE